MAVELRLSVRLGDVFLWYGVASDYVGLFCKQFHQYQVVGRALPTPANETPKAYRMKLWATDEVRAKSKFWYDSRNSKLPPARVFVV